jgi:hypothetical protein
MRAAMDADDLYGLPLDRFIPERGALAKALRVDKRRDEAAAVAALRKPSVAAWSVNQLVRTQHDAVAELFAAGDALRDAQSDLLAGRGDARALRAAGDEERAAVRRLVETARGLLTSEGHELSETVVERVADTLHAAALDEGLREQVREGRLERELRHVGLGLGESPAPAAQPAVRPKREAAARAPAKARAEATAGTEPRPSAAERAAARAAEQERVAAERAGQERVQRERDEARKAARTAQSAARRRAERAARALANAQERHDRAAQALAEAEQELADARAEAAEARAEHERAQAELSGI